MKFSFAAVPDLIDLLKASALYLYTAKIKYSKLKSINVQRCTWFLGFFKKYFAEFHVFLSSGQTNNWYN